MPLSLTDEKITFFDSTTLSPYNIKWGYISTSTNLSSNFKYSTDTTLEPITATLPPNPAHGNFVILVDNTGAWEVNNLTINRSNNKTINGFAENLICDVSYAKIELIYNMSTNDWRVTF